jgi:hypothetical protein
MLASEFDGERANAARMIAKMAAAEKKTVAEFVMSPQTIYRDRVVYKDAPQQPKAKPRPEYNDDDLRRYRPHPGSSGARRGRGSNPILDKLREARDRPEMLTGWEMEFIESVLVQCFSDEDLTYRQEKAAKKIIVKMELYDDPLV